MYLVTLTENTAANPGLQAEHGLSLYLETGGYGILFDFGQSDLFAENAEKLGVDLARADLAVLSHGHYDHGGGLGRFLEINKKAPVYVSCHGFAPHFNAKGKDIGLDLALEGHPRLVFTRGETQIAPGLRLVTLESPPELPSGHLFADRGVCKPEDYRHEQYLLAEEAGKRILISGCSHKGIQSIVRAFRPDILIGGFHFMNVRDQAYLDRAAWVLLEGNTCYYTGHCTGAEQFAFLKTRMGDRLHALRTGDSLNL